MLVHADEDIVLWRHLAGKRACDALGDELRGRVVVQNEDDELRALKAGKRALRDAHFRFAFPRREEFRFIAPGSCITCDWCSDRLNIVLGESLEIKAFYFG